MEEKVFIQHQASSVAVHNGLFIVGWQTQSNGNESVTVADLTPIYDSQSNAESAQGTGAPLADKLVSTGVIVRSDFFGNYVVVAESSGNDLLSVASNLIESVRALGDNWYAILITPQSEALLRQTLSDSTASSQ